MSVKWLRPEFKGREGELETRSDFEKRTGITAQALSSRFTNYADRMPKVVKKFGKTKYFVGAELDEFVAWIAENSGTRSDSDIRRAEIARIENAIDECSDRVEEHKRNVEKAEKDRAKFKRQLRVKKEELDFLIQTE
jgi:hypothetical protein